jgi:hypothetical protein
MDAGGDRRVEDGDNPGQRQRRQLPRPTLTFVGTIAGLIQAGGGKLSTQAPDGPDVRKPPGQ